MSNSIEIKNEFTFKLISIIQSCIYEGISSIYDDAKEISEESEILKVFQGLLRRVPKWNISIIEDEKNRIITKTGVTYLDNLLRAIIKMNLIVMLNHTKDNVLDKSLYDKVDLGTFVHSVYILVARKIFNNPFLMYHKQAHCELKKNQQMVFDLIEKEINNSIRDLLPFEYILDEVLNNEIYDEQLKLDIPSKSERVNKLSELQAQEGQIRNLEPFPIRAVSDVINNNNLKFQIGGKSRNSDKFMGKTNRSAKHNSTNSDKKLEERFNKLMSHSTKIKLSEGGRIDEIIKNKHNEAKKVNNDSDTSMSYGVNNNDGFEEVFSNDNEVRKVSKNVDDAKRFKKTKVDSSSSHHKDLFTTGSKYDNVGKNHRQYYKV